MFDFLRFFLGLSIWFFVIVIALWRGERPERIVAASTFIAIFATPLAQLAPFDNAPVIGAFVVDLANTLIITWVALTFDRWWALFNAAFHFIMVGIHIVQMTLPSGTPMSYGTAAVVYSYFGLFSLGAGMIALERRRMLGRRA